MTDEIQEQPAAPAPIDPRARNDFTAEERAVLTASYKDRDARGVRGFAITKPELVALMRAAKQQAPDDRAALTRAVQERAPETIAKIDGAELERFLSIAHPAPVRVDGAAPEENVEAAHVER